MRGIFNNVKYYRNILFFKSIFPIEYFHKIYKSISKWNYLGNGILDNLVFNKLNNNDFKFIEVDSIFARPENIFMKGKPIDNYLNFYFFDRETNQLINKCKGII